MTDIISPINTAPNLGTNSIDYTITLRASKYSFIKWGQHMYGNYFIVTVFYRYILSLEFECIGINFKFFNIE